MRLYLAFRSGWSKHGNARRARAGTNSVYMNSGLRFSEASPASNPIAISFGPRGDPRRVDDQVLGGRRQRDAAAVRPHALRARRREIERQRPRRIYQREADRDLAADRRRGLGRDREAQLVSKIADAARPLFRERQRNAGARVPAGSTAAAAVMRWTQRDGTQDRCPDQAGMISAEVASELSTPKKPTPNSQSVWGRRRVSFTAGRSLWSSEFLWKLTLHATARTRSVHSAAITTR